MRLEAARDALWEAVDGPARRRAIDKGLVDTTAEGMLRRRYESASTSELHRSIEQVHKNRRAADRDAHESDPIGDLEPSCETNPTDGVAEAETLENSRVPDAVPAAIAAPEAAPRNGPNASTGGDGGQAASLSTRPRPPAHEALARLEGSKAQPIDVTAWDGLTEAHLACPEGAVMP